MSETDGKYYNEYVFNKQSVLGAGRVRERTCARSGACSAAVPCVKYFAAAGSLGILGRNGLYTQEDLLNKW